MAEKRVVWAKKLPDVYRKLDEIDHVLAGHLDVKLLELIKLRASVLNGCAFCVDLHTQKALKEGESQQRLFLVSTWYEAGERFNEAVRLRPRFSEGHNNIGVVHFLQGRIDAAIQAYERALLADPDNGEAHYNLGLALYHDKDLPGAIRHYRKALDLNPRLDQAHSDLGVALMAVKDPDGAARHLWLAEPFLAPALAVGESIAVNGVCLTVVSADGDEVNADVSPETMRVTALGALKRGSIVNLERPLRADARVQVRERTNVRDLQPDLGDVRTMIPHNEVIFTGPVDEFFDYRFGKLPYRSLRFQFETRLLKEFAVFGQRVKMFVHARFNELGLGLGARLQFHQRPHWLANGDELPARFEHPFPLAQRRRYDGIGREVAPTESGGLADLLQALRSAADELELQLNELSRSLPDRINAEPASAGQELGRLVLTLVEVIRKVLEHQAVRRMDSGTLTAEEVERLGLALLRLSERMNELKSAFGLRDEDLDIDLGPLGRLR